jgi:two-component system clock-associated histidine kinase SasA
MVPSINDSAVFEDPQFKQNSLQLLLFINNRRSSQKNIEEIKNYLNDLTKEFDFNLEVIEIEKQPHLVEHFKLVATPALVKINPLPKQTLAGSNLIGQLQKCWYQWQDSLKQQKDSNKNHSSSSVLQTCLPSSELILLTDEIFRLKQEKEELKKQLKFKDQILEMLAHDLRSPLTAASMALETIQLLHKERNLQKKAELQAQLYQQAKRQFKIMNKMIVELLETSKTVRRELNIMPLELDLSSLCNEIMLNLKPKLEQKNQKLIKDIPQDLPSVYADAELIRQVMVNLLENAIKYTPNNGQITISILHKTAGKIQASISDNGPGIPEEKRELIFSGHFRLQRDETTDGYGIGLALCRKVINSHYGQIWVDNNADQGSSFHFTLPVYR